MLAIAAVVGLLVAGSLIYCVLAVVAARSYLAQKSPSSGPLAPISVLKPLAGVDEGLESNLRTFFEQDHPEFEILFAVREAGDPAIGIVQALQHEYPGRATRLIVTGPPPYPNAKIFSLDQMLAQAKYDVLVMSDSDIRVAKGFLRAIALEFSDPNVALATCPYRAIAGKSLWSELEAEGMNSEFLAGLLVARLIEGVKFAVGPTIAARKQTVAAIGGLAKLKDYLAEDFVMGKFAAAAGLGVILSRATVQHHIGSEGFQANAAHRLRWVRSTRRSRPAGYLGQLVTYPLPLAVLACAVQPSWWPLLPVTCGLRALAAWSTCAWILRSKPRWHLLVLQDFLSFFFWLAGFFGNTIIWRGRRYYLRPDGRFELR
ncbi:MAG TPA: bacteriohopanetetrol glucosamine biosynthesis glycosyltransferase HpnI [Bryobacteraceae bacterium]|nr:bacteriohopanetetrol glucosamine biosynthesis glycosyltransferase HpnI [Bryobacteraceae bacterium]